MSETASSAASTGVGPDSAATGGNSTAASPPLLRLLRLLMQRWSLFVPPRRQCVKQRPVYEGGACRHSYQPEREEGNIVAHIPHFKPALNKRNVYCSVMVQRRDTIIAAYTCSSRTSSMARAACLSTLEKNTQTNGRNSRWNMVGRRRRVRRS